MKFKIINLIYIYFFYIQLGISFSIWKEEIDYQENSNVFENDIIHSYSYSTNDYSSSVNFKMKSCACFDTEEIRGIIPGEVLNEKIYNEKLFIYKFNSFNYNKENDLLIQFYPLDCHIKIIIESENDENDTQIEKISNFEYDAFYKIIKKENINSTYFKVKTLTNSVNGYNKNRKFHLIINSFEYVNNTNLIIKEKEPTFIYFNNTIDRINLIYNLINNKKDNFPISISFFIKERVKFEITVSNNESESFNRIVSYTDRILIDTNFFPIKIHIKKLEEDKDAVMIAKVIKDFSTPIYFQKNILNIGFIPSSTSYQYYYMEIFKGEEGGIILNNKKYKGILISKLIEKGEAKDCDIFYSSGCYPKEDEKNISLLDDDYLKYDEYSQNLTITNNQTDKCEDGCYLLITYYSIYFGDEKHNKKIIGTEFTLLSILLEEENEIKSQIVNIPFNEHIYGLIDSSSHNIHYYSIFIPEKTNNIKVDFPLSHISIYIYEGIERFNIYKSKYFIKSDYSIHENKIKLIGGQYYTFGVTIEDRDSYFYYFKICLANSTNGILIYPLDSNKGNRCDPTEKDGIYSCYFFIDNIYKDLYNDLILYALANENINYTVWFEENNERTYYSIDLDNLRGKKNKSENNTF